MVVTTSCYNLFAISLWKWEHFYKILFSSKNVFNFWNMPFIAISPLSLIQLLKCNLEGSKFIRYWKIRKWSWCLNFLFMKFWPCGKKRTDFTKRELTAIEAAEICLHDNIDILNKVQLFKTINNCRTSKKYKPMKNLFLRIWNIFLNCSAWINSLVLRDLSCFKMRIA